jgi:hypothetical protein
MQIVSQVMSTAAFGAAAWAAYRWYQATKIEVPCDLQVAGHVYEGCPELKVYGVEEINRALWWQSEVNRQAAMWTGIAALLSVFASTLSNFGL